MRLDIYLVSNNLVKSRSQATDYIKRGLVLNNGTPILKPGYEIKDTDLIKLVETKHFVGRAGEKLFHAITEFKIDFNDKIVVDIGSSTGGFSQCALEHGAKFVYAYDVGSDQMDPQLKKDQRIELHEQTNILDVDIPFCDICLIDVSFTSILPILKHLKGFNKEILALIKPQFEVGKNQSKGVVKDIKMIEHVLKNITNEMSLLGFQIKGIAKSYIKGKKGNQEYMVYLDKTVYKDIDLKKMIGDVLC